MPIIRPFLKPFHVQFSLHKIPSFPFHFQQFSLFCTSALHNSIQIANYSKKDQFFHALFKKCSTQRDYECMHAHVIQTGFNQNLFVVGKIIEFYAISEHASMNHAVSVFKTIQNPDGFLWNTMIRGFGRVNQVEQVFSYYKRMIQSGEVADNFTFSFLLKVSAQSGSIMLGKQLHCNTIKHGLDCNVFVRNTLIHMYGMRNHFEIAHQLFVEIPRPDLVAWNTVIDCHVYCEEFEVALDLFFQMWHSGINPDKATLVVILSACSALGNLELGRQVHSYIDRAPFQIDVQLLNSLIDMYSKCGEVEEAHNLFSTMNERNTVTWNSMILGLATHGHVHKALQLFLRMVNEKIVSPDDVTFLGVLTACSHGGRIEEGRKFFHCMINEYRIQPTIKHYGCMVDIFGRAGCVEEAYELVRSMPIQCNAIVWRTLLASCRVHGKVELGELVRKHLLELEPYHSSDYVLLANMYACAGQWDDVSSVRKSMKNGGIQKPNPGNSFIGIPSRMSLALESTEAR